MLNDVAARLYKAQKLLRLQVQTHSEFRQWCRDSWCGDSVCFLGAQEAFSDNVLRCIRGSWENADVPAKC